MVVIAIKRTCTLIVFFIHLHKISQGKWFIQSTEEIVVAEDSVNKENKFSPLIEDVLKNVVAKRRSPGCAMSCASYQLE
jgi:hypothetical protein